MPSASSGRPHAEPFQPGLNLGGFQKELVAGVRRIGVGPGQAPAYQFQVDHGAVDPDIAEEPPVAVGLRHVLFETNRFSLDEVAVGLGGLPGKWLQRAHLRRIHPDVADALTAGQHDGVAVNDAGDAAGVPRGRYSEAAAQAEGEQ